MTPALSSPAPRARAKLSKHERDVATAKRVSLEAFTCARKHGTTIPDVPAAFFYLCGWLGITDEQIDEILRRERPQQ